MPLDHSLPPSPAPARKPERVRAREAKKLMVEILKKYPIVEAACNKVGISRSTHYEWMNRDDRYREKIEQAMALSVDTVNDIAENNIITGVKRGDHKASTFWLKYHKAEYKQQTRTIVRADESEFGIDLLAEAKARMSAISPERPANRVYRDRDTNKPRLTGEAGKRVKKYLEEDDEDA